MYGVETGRLSDGVGLPYVRAGRGSKPLVVVPGIDDAMFSGRYTRPIGQLAYWYFSRYVDDYAVYVVSRQRGLPEGHRIQDMADDYARALEGLEPVDVLGFSMGGMIGLSLAIRRPETVDRLVLANSGARIADLDAVDRFRQYARDRRWGRIRSELSVAMFSDWRAFAYPPLARTVGQIAPRPADPEDVVVSLDAIEAFDATPRLGDVGPPTLVFGGAEDPLFPRSVLEATAEGIPDGRLSIVPDGKHGAFHERKATFDDTVTAFLGSAPRSIR